MTMNLEKVRAEARESLSRASTISVEEHQTTLTKTDFRCIKEKMNKIDQKLDGLYKNWQAEYKEAVTLEQCEDIQKYYEPHVQKYERKYRWLCGTLKQAIGERKRISSPRVTTPELTPSLAALEDATTLKEKAEERSKPDVE